MSACKYWSRADIDVVIQRYVLHTELCHATVRDGSEQFLTKFDILAKTHSYQALED